MYLCEAQHTFLASAHLFLELALTSYWTVFRPCRHATWFFAMEVAILYLPSWKLPYLAHGQLTRMQHGSSSILEFASPKFQTLNTPIEPMGKDIPVTDTFSRVTPMNPEDDIQLPIRKANMITTHISTRILMSVQPQDSLSNKLDRLRKSTVQGNQLTRLKCSKISTSK